MRSWLLMCCLLLSAVLFAGCGPRRDPRIEPVKQERKDAGVIYYQLTASTNCAEVGEEVIFTAVVTSESTVPLTIVDTSPFDIVIRPFRSGGDAGPIQRWSETGQYPADINPTLQPRETRTYTWRWIAVAAYTRENMRDNGVRADMTITIGYPGGGSRQSSLPDLVVGVEANPRLGDGIRCSDFR